MYNILWLLGFLLFVHSSVAVDELNSLLSREMYKYEQNEVDLAHSVVRLFNKHTNGYSVGFFISPTRVAALFHGVCCFNSPISETLSITQDGKSIAVDKVVYADAYSDLVVVEVSGFVSKDFLKLSEKDDLQIKDEVRTFGYVANYPNVVRFKGKVVEKGSHFFKSALSFYELSGGSGTPVFGKDDTVKGIIFTTSANVALVIPVRKLREIMKEKETCMVWKSCQSAAMNTLVSRIEQQDAHAQYILGLLLKKGLGPYLVDYIDRYKVDISLDGVLLWYLAAEAGHKEAMFNFGSILIRFNNKKDINGGIQFIRKAAEAGDISANHSMAVLFRHFLSKLEGALDMKDVLNVDDILGVGDALGIKDALNREDILDMEGALSGGDTLDIWDVLGMLDALDKEEHYLTIAASQGHVFAEVDLCKFYHKKYRESKTDKERKFYKEEALSWCRTAAWEHGHPEAARMMLRILSE